MRCGSGSAEGADRPDWSRSHCAYRGRSRLSCRHWRCWGELPRPSLMGVTEQPKARFVRVRVRFSRARQWVGPRISVVLPETVNQLKNFSEALSFVGLRVRSSDLEHRSRGSPDSCHRPGGSMAVLYRPCTSNDGSRTMKPPVGWAHDAGHMRCAGDEFES